jgi:asparagine synthase (glutamine-hydrolysing)
MCGIVGALAFNGYAITRPYIDAMRDTMFHRGPDGADTWIAGNEKIGLGHRRLSIIDLSTTATQPMQTPSGRYVLTYNGEIYNHAELREALMQEGVLDWKTDHSDTEVLLRAFEQWGIDCVHRLRGMFAFGIWDAQEQQLWLVRDHVGIKPLYYSIHNRRVTFASEIKALLKDPDQPRDVDHTAMYHYLSFLTTPAPQTLFAGIKKLEPGTWLRISAKGDVKKHKYWEVLDHLSPKTGVSEDDLAEEILAKLRESVRLRQASDVPVGVFLSGGIDSSTNAALFAENSHGPVNTFSIGYEGTYDSYQNELHFAKQMAESVSANYHEKRLDIDDLMGFLPEMVKLQDEPIADPVCVPVYYVSKLAKDNGVTVCQVGEGADELYWGYASWKYFLNLQKLADIPGTRGIQKLGVKLIEAMGKDHRMEYELLRRGANRLPVFWGGAQAFTEQQKKQVLSQSMRRSLSGLDSWQALAPHWQRFQDKAWEPSALNWMSYLDLNMRLPELLLMRVDKMSMGVSLEGRVPFLDKEFVQLALSIPAKMKTKGGNSKHLLKKAVRGLIPDNLIDRKKQGFGVPVYEWMFDKLGDQTRQELDFFCRETDFLDRKACDHLLQSGAGPQVWYLLNFALWWKEYIYQ